MRAADDGRLSGQEEYLLNVTLVHWSWQPSNPKNDHDHCEFCWEKFSHYDGCLQVGYSTEDRYRWVCERCFNDFRERFKWKVKADA